MAPSEMTIYGFGGGRANYRGHTISKAIASVRHKVVAVFRYFHIIQGFMVATIQNAFFDFRSYFAVGKGATTFQANQIVCNCTTSARLHSFGHSQRIRNIEKCSENTGRLRIKTQIREIT